MLARGFSLHTHPFVSVVIAFVVLFFALGGTAIAAPRHPVKHGSHRHSSRKVAMARAAVIGGSPAEMGTFPWLARIVDNRPEGTELCTGTIVAPSLILTAGHCAENMETGVVNESSGYSVVTGNVEWTSPERQMSAVSKVVVYPGFIRSVDEGDAALLVLSTPTTAPAISLAAWPSDSNILQAGTGAVIAGWGETEETFPERLQWAETVVQAPEWCEGEVKMFYEGSELCAVDPPSYSTGACSGDSGGPLIAETSSGAPVEIGVTIRASADCSTSHPTVFTRADLLASWVHEWAEAVKPPPPPASPTPTPAPAPTPAPVTSAPSVPATHTSSSTTQQIPTMNKTEANHYLHELLSEVFGRRFKRGVDYEHRCRRSSSTRFVCEVNWGYGPNDYYGSVSVYYFIYQGQVLSNGKGVVQWVNEKCHFHSHHPQRCKVNTSDV
ncbi:MAG: serine protease [Solirubrobacteraceae bacterium]